MSGSLRERTCAGIGSRCALGVDVRVHREWQGVDVRCDWVWAVDRIVLERLDGAG